MLGYLGPKGTFSHQAAMEWSRGNEELKEFSTIYSAIKAVSDGTVERSIVPIENSIEGSVNTTLDALAFDVDLYITDEFILDIRQNLMVKKGAKAEDIRLITSHPQPIGQCAKMLERNFRDIPIEFAASTAAAARLVAQSDGHTACIASKSSAQLFDLDILMPDCNDEHNNSTRFIVIESKPSGRVTECDKTSLAFSLKNVPGSLYNALKLFAEYNINMIKIESRPVKTQMGTYVFFVDIDGNIDDANIYFAMDKLRQNTIMFKFLGSYKKEVLN